MDQKQMTVKAICQWQYKTPWAQTNTPQTSFDMYDYLAHLADLYKSDTRNKGMLCVSSK
jgi:hypothetical protein